MVLASYAEQRGESPGISAAGMHPIPGFAPFARAGLRFAGWLAVAGLLASVARAHNPYESWVTGRLRGDRFEVSITMAQITAVLLLDPKIRALTPENFPTHRARLEAAAAGFLVFTAAQKALPLRRATVELTPKRDGTDIGWHASFDRTLGGRLVRGILRRVYHEVVDCLAAAAETRQ